MARHRSGATSEQTGGGEHRRGKGLKLDEILRSKKVIEALMEKSARIAEYWQSVSPVFDESNPDEHRRRPGVGQPGAYKAAIKITAWRDNRGVPIYRVEDTDPKAYWVEYRNKGSAEFAPMARTRAFFRSLK